MKKIFEECNQLHAFSLNGKGYFECLENKEPLLATVKIDFLSGEKGWWLVEKEIKNKPDEYLPFLW